MHNLLQIVSKRSCDVKLKQPLRINIKFLLEQTRDTNRMVEEMMLLANTTVAAKILESFPACACLRRHPPPDPRKFEALQVALKSAGISLDLTSSRTLADSLDKAVMKTDPFFNTLVRMMTTRCLNEVCIIIT